MVLYKIPLKWKEYDDWSERGFGFLDGNIVYFKDIPEEMYYISFIGDSTGLVNSRQSILAVRAVHREGGIWLKAKDFDLRERTIIEKRFAREIISKLSQSRATDKLPGFIKS